MPNHKREEPVIRVTVGLDQSIKSSLAFVFDKKIRCVSDLGGALCYWRISIAS